MWQRQARRQRATASQPLPASLVISPAYYSAASLQQQQQQGWENQIT